MSVEPASPPRDVQNLSRFKTAGLLALIVAIHVAGSAAWMYANGFFNPVRPPFHDCAYFRLDAHEIQRTIEKEGPIGVLTGADAHDRPHPPLLAVLNALAGLPIHRIDVRTQWAVQALYLALLVVSLYLLGRQILRTRGRALLFAFFASGAPVYIASARVALPKFPMMVMVFFALHALLMSRAFSRRGWSVMFGFWTGVAVMTMMLAPIYLAGSVVVAFLIGLRRGPRRAVIANAAIAFVVAAAIVALWYPKHWERVAEYARVVTSEEGQRFWSAGIPMWSLERWIYYPVYLVDNGLGFFLAAAIVVTLLLRVVTWPFGPRPSPVEGSPTRNGLILAAGVIVSLVIVARGQVAAQSQYIMNMPALVLLLGYACAWRLPTRALRGGALALLACGSIVSAALTFRPIDQDVIPEPKSRWSIPLTGASKLNIIDSMDTYGGGPARTHGLSATPDAEPWPVKEVVAAMEANRTFHEIRLFQVIGASSAYMTPGNLEYVARRRGLGFRVLNSPGFPPYRAEDFAEVAREAEFLVSDTTYAQKDTTTAKNEGSGLAALDGAGAKLVKLFERRVSPLANVILYKIVHPDRTVQVVQAVPADAVAESVEYDSGWTLKGLQHAKGKGPDDVILTTYWEATPPKRSGFEVLTRTQAKDPSAPEGWRTLADSRRDLHIPAVSEGTMLMMRSGPLPMPPGSRMLLVMPRISPQSGEEGEATVRSTTLPKWGLRTVVALERSANGDVVVGANR